MVKRAGRRSLLKQQIAVSEATATKLKTKSIKKRPNIQPNKLNIKKYQQKLDYEQSLLFLSLSNKTRENAHARNGLVSRVSRLRCSTLSHSRG